MEILKNVNLLRDYIMLKYQSHNTAKNYCSALTMFLVHFKDYPEPKAVSDEKIIDYLLQIPGHSNRRTHHSAVKLFYKVKGQPHKFRFIPYPEKEDKLPIHVNKDEFFKMISVCNNEKHRLLITIMFDAGLRVSEVRNLRIQDIDTSNMVLNIIRSKKKKDRKVKLSGIVLTMIKSYIITHKPDTYLFNGQGSLQYSVKSIQEVTKQLCVKAGINKHFTPHKFRHGFAMTLLENGENLSSIQNQMGHESSKTTEIYARINNKVIQKIESPLEQLIREKGSEMIKTNSIEAPKAPERPLPATISEKTYRIMFNGKQFEMHATNNHIIQAPEKHKWTINKDESMVLQWYQRKGYQIISVSK